MDRGIFHRAGLAVVMLTAWSIVLSYWAGPIQAAQAATDVDLSFFYDRLAPYGDWVEHPRYSWVWCPRDVSVEWRPYTDGHWVYTDEFGWLWESDQPWGWACFHYGRWDWDDQLGWFWVPGYTWGPAWVAWCTAPDYIGWAPLPPVVRWRPGIGLDLHGFDLDDIPARRWCFVSERFFDEPILRTHILLPSRNVTIFSQRRNVTRFDVVDGRIVDVGVPVGRIEQVTGRRVTHFRVSHVDSVAAMRLPRERDGVINVFSPRVGPARDGAVPPHPGELERRQQVERSQLEERQRAERNAMEQRHQMERVAPRARPEQFQPRQEAERRALQSEHERQQRLLSNRQQEESQRMGAGGPAVARRDGSNRFPRR